MNPEKKIRVLIAKPGLDGHDRGAKILALALRDAGFEVIYTGVRQTPRQIADAVIQEDPDVIMLSSLSGAHERLFKQIFERLKKADCTDKLFLAGGIIPEKDHTYLHDLGVSHIFSIHASMDEVISVITQHFQNGY
ncbi:MAG TPA: cobalamin B12-binding domain-containing protein [bacterium]|nr:cobalamin B12-binding domain-containing protein [bacterium]